MPELLEWFFIALFLGGILTWVIFPAGELIHVLRRIASGDYRPVILKGMPRFFRRTAENLRVVAETLARQQVLLAEEEFSLAIILESMTEGVVITGSDLRIRLVNKAAEEMFHLQSQVEGLLLHEVFLHHEFQAVAQRAATTGEVQRGELTLAIPGRSERCHLVITAAALRGEKKATPDALLLVLHDITRLRELESVRREFVANVSHEFRTPLSVINGYLETLEEGNVSRAMFTKSISVMKRHGNRLNRLIEDLLTISRMEEKGVRLDASPTDLAPLLRNIVEQMEQELGARGVTLHLEVQQDLPLVEVDAYRIEQAFSNLLANAISHGRTAGGSVLLSLALVGAELQISFCDNGPGIPLSDQEHIFERFYRVGGDRARHTGGTGLGLSIVKNVVTAHGGRVALESKPGAGSTFSIFLPVEAG